MLEDYIIDDRLRYEDHYLGVLPSAWKELGRFTSEVKEYVEVLESLGITHFGSKL